LYFYPPSLGVFEVCGTIPPVRGALCTIWELSSLIGIRAPT
jgi:hypothetical protein